MGLVRTVKTAAISKAVQTALNYLEKDPEQNIPKVMDLVDKVTPKGWYEGQRKMIRQVIDEKGNWYQMILKIYDLDPGVRKAFFENFITNASLKGSSKQHEIQDKYNCNVPWAVLLDPTSACNLRCTGCWAAEYGYKLNLTYEDIDSIINQANDLGCYMIIYTGGEPTVRKDDIFKLCEAHPDTEFLSFTNGTLIDEDFCKEMLRVKNFVPAISLEGFEEANDDRRGQGVFDKVMRAMDLLRENKLAFGVSACYTRKNCEDISSDEFLEKVIEKGALFIWYFHFMPVGHGSSPDLMCTPEQREMMFHRIRSFRDRYPIFAMDFQNDGEFVGGCIAGGRRYLHINARGDVEPCVFIHYSNVNIHDVSLLDALRSPLFQAYHDNQPFNDNMLRPCPMLENPGELERLVDETHAHNTDVQEEETAAELGAKTAPYAKNWQPTAEKLWAERLEFKAKKAKEAEEAEYAQASGK